MLAGCHIERSSGAADSLPDSLTATQSILERATSGCLSLVRGRSARA